jgi:hypothetical protein
MEREALARLDAGYEIDDEAEDDRLLYERPDDYHQREEDRWLHEVVLREAAKRRLTKT